MEGNVEPKKGGGKGRGRGRARHRQPEDGQPGQPASQQPPPQQQMQLTPRPQVHPTGPSPLQQPVTHQQPVLQQAWCGVGLGVHQVPICPTLPPAQPQGHEPHLVCAKGPQPKETKPSAPPQTKKSGEVDRKKCGKIQEQVTLSDPAPAHVQSSKALCPPVRKDYGTLGDRISLSANHFLVKITKKTIFHYDVELKAQDSKAPSKVLSNKVMQQFLISSKRIREATPVFDGRKNLYTARPISGLSSKVEFSFTYRESDRGEPREINFKIEVQPTGEVEIDLSALDAYMKRGSSVDPPSRPIQALDIALRNGAVNRKIIIGSCLLSKEMGQPKDLGGGVEVWFGHFQSLRIGWKPFLIVDASQKAFVRPGLVHEWMAELFRTRPGESLRDGQYKEFGKKVATLKVSYQRENYVASVGCNGLKGPANREKFDCEGRQVTVEQYFREKYGVRLRFPNLPCLWVGSRERNNLVPMEICSIGEGQEYRRKLSDIQTSNMIKVAATPADERRRKIETAVANMNFQNDPTAKEFGVSVDSKLAKVQGRVLPAPKLLYGPDLERPNPQNECVPRGGTWNMAGKRFVDPKALKHWGILNISRASVEEVHHFAQQLFKAAGAMGMTVDKYLFNRPCSDRDLEGNMREAKKRFPQLQILFVVISRKGDSSYEVVKRVGDLELCLTTQCVQSKNVVGRPGQGPDASTLANICMKLNAKLGGTNNLISRSVRPKILLSEQVVIMGADVTHPGADQQDSSKPSIAAVVGSVDPRAFRYCTEIRIQASRQEYIEDMENMVFNILRKFNSINGSTSTAKPQRIIFYRDGVSEGQFAKILEWELSAIRKACMRLENGYNPPITFIVVQKRHHTRLFADDKRDQVGKAGNVPPGTVVDTDIVHPTENDFFLVSHFGIQGTSRPTHYHLLWDDSKFTSNELQILTYYLCYLFSRCTRSVSYPAPCYYSHLVAYRGRQYYDELTGGGNMKISNADLQRSIDKCRDIQFMFFV